MKPALVILALILLLSVTADCCPKEPYISFFTTSPQCGQQGDITLSWRYCGDNYTIYKEWISNSLAFKVHEGDACNTNPCTQFWSISQPQPQTAKYTLSVAKDSFPTENKTLNI